MWHNSWYWVWQNKEWLFSGVGVAALGVVWWVFKKVTRTSPPAVVPNSPHVDNRPEVSANISPIISPNFSPTFSPTINIGTPAVIAAAAPGNRPKLTLDRWDTKAETLDSWQSGFYVSNHGETALDVRVQRVQVAAGNFAFGSPVASIPAHQRNVLIPVWLEGYGSHDREKWDLCKAMKTASDARHRGLYGQPDYIIPVAVRYKDFDDNVYETTADLHYVPARFELVFHSVHQRKIDDATEVLDHLQRNSRPGSATPQLVESIASAVSLSEERTAAALERLVAEGQALRSQIDARWDYVYWYAHY